MSNSQTCFCNLIPEIQQRMTLLENPDKYLLEREQQINSKDQEIALLSKDLIQRSQQVKQLSLSLPASQIINQQQQLIESLLETQDYTQKLFNQVYQEAQQTLPLADLPNGNDQFKLAQGLQYLGSSIIEFLKSQQ